MILIGFEYTFCRNSTFSWTIIMGFCSSQKRREISHQTLSNSRLISSARSANSTSVSRIRLQVLSQKSTWKTSSNRISCWISTEHLKLSSSLRSRNSTFSKRKKSIRTMLSQSRKWFVLMRLKIHKRTSIRFRAPSFLRTPSRSSSSSSV